MQSTPYHFISAHIDQFRFLSGLKSLYGEKAEIEIYFDRDQNFDRLAADGIFCVRGQVKGRTVSTILTDFRVGGGSFGHSNMDRTHAFIREINGHAGSLVFILNTLGARFTEGRTLFNSVFNIIPALYSYAKNHPYFGVAHGKALGLGAIFFGQAHYRITTSSDTLINLTGPEVLNQFFGENHNFDKFASSAHQMRANTLIHEETNSLDSALGRVKTILQYPVFTSTESAKSWLEPDPARPKYMKSERELVKILSSFSTHAVELFPQLSEVARIFMVNCAQHPVGLIMNPPLHPNNMLSVRAVEKSQAAIELFERLRVPVISLIDSPGGDPRPSESDQDAILKMVKLVHTMIDYPFGKMGIVLNRCYGGACMFAFPKIFGAERSLVLEGSKIGIISESIIENLVQNTPRLREEWSRTKSTQAADLSDLIATDAVDRVISLGEVRVEVESFIKNTLPLRARPEISPVRATGVHPTPLRLAPKPKTAQSQPAYAEVTVLSHHEGKAEMERGV